MSTVKIMTLALAILAGSSQMIGPASAMPVDGLALAAKQMAGTQQARWVCGYYGCRWRPDYRYYYYRGGPYWGGPYSNCYYNGCCPPGMTIQSGVCKPYRGY